MITNLFAWLLGLLESFGVEALIILVFAFLGSWLGTWRARRQWKTREFFNRINVSLNSIAEGTLRIRTILEDEIETVFINGAAANAVKSCARQTTEEDPILPIGEEDAWFVLNEVLNTVSEHFSSGHLKSDLGAPVHTARYLMTLTNERAGKMRTYKVRAMLIRKDTLLSLPEDAPAFESETHRTRWKTLQKMAAAYQAMPYRFIEVELSQ